MECSHDEVEHTGTKDQILEDGSMLKNVLFSKCISCGLEKCHEYFMNIWDIRDD